MSAVKLGVFGFHELRAMSTYQHPYNDGTF